MSNLGMRPVDKMPQCLTDKSHFILIEKLRTSLSVFQKEGFHKPEVESVVAMNALLRKCSFKVPLD